MPALGCKISRKPASAQRQTAEPLLQHLHLARLRLRLALRLQLQLSLSQTTQHLSQTLPRLQPSQALRRGRPLTQQRLGLLLCLHQFTPLLPGATTPLLHAQRLPSQRLGPILLQQPLLLARGPHHQPGRTAALSLLLPGATALALHLHGLIAPRLLHLRGPTAHYLLLLGQPALQSRPFGRQAPELQAAMSLQARPGLQQRAMVPATGKAPSP